MTAPVQPTLEGDVPPPPRRRVEDYETWVLEVRPVFVEVAKSGRRQFLCWQIEDEYDLPDPPNRQSDWGRLMARLHNEELIEPDGFGHTRDRSCITAWRGTRAARTGRVA